MARFGLPWVGCGLGFGCVVCFSFVVVVVLFNSVGHFAFEGAWIYAVWLVWV